MEIQLSHVELGDRVGDSPGLQLVVGSEQVWLSRDMPAVERLAAQLAARLAV
jgi:hypothetical protein